MSKHPLLVSILLLLLQGSLLAQTQTVSGVVTDVLTKETLPGANIFLLDHEPLLGTSTNADGSFQIKDVPLGRHDFQISFLGYKTKIISGILVSSGREVYLEIELEEEIFEGEGIEVVATISKDKPLNDMAYVSAKTFTVEETQKYAGGLDDPARLVTAFAGVSSSGGIQHNAISIRGNAPKSVQWRLEGIEIPNPSHFAGLSVAGGGGVTLFSSQLLSNSDFMTGAFPAEYGNALSGVFDINFRTENPNQREHAVQIGLNGLEFSSGGPFRKNSRATYLFNYRFSTLTLLMPLLPVDGIIRYQDLSFNIDLPTQKGGRFSFWGIGGLDYQNFHAKKDSTEWKYAAMDKTDLQADLGVGAMGISHSIIAGKQGYLKTTLAVSGNKTQYDQDRINSSLNFDPELRVSNNTSRIALKSYYNQKIKRVNLRTGFEIQNLRYDIDLKARPDNQSAITQVMLGDGTAMLGQVYTQTDISITPKLSFLAGIHGQWFSLSDEVVPEPRAALNWQVSKKTGFSLGYGLHSQIEELGIYYVRNSDGIPNKDLKMSKAHHLVLGWNQRLGDQHRMKVELFGQRLFDVPVIADSSFSMLNFIQDLTFNETLVNKGQGENYGIEFTLERFLNKGYYYLLTGTLYTSEYKGGDGIWRKSRFAQTAIANALFGKEYFLNGSKNVLGINTRVSLTGGERYSPVLETRSSQYRDVVHDESKAFTRQFDTSFVVDLTLSYRTNRTNYSSVVLFQVKNLLSAKDKFFDYNQQTRQVDLIEEGTVLPVLSWKIEF